MDSNMGGGYTPPPVHSDPSLPPSPGGGETIYPTTPAKDPIVVLVLNLIVVCVGYFYLGQWQKGVAAIVGAIVIGIPTCGLGVGAIAIAAGIDGMFQAQHLQAGHPIGQWTWFKNHK